MKPTSRTLALSALLGMTVLAAPLTVLAADPVAPVAAATPPAATMPDVVRPDARETVEQRISRLHASLAITPAQEADWGGVTRAMRENASTMEKLMADRSALDPSKMTALDDLATYEKFGRAHVDGLKNLTMSFTTLYNEMPDAQKRIADDVFRKFGHDKPAGRT